MSFFPDSLRLGQTADLEGAFFGCGIALGRVECEGLSFQARFAGRGELDRIATAGESGGKHKGGNEEFDIISISPAAWAAARKEFALLGFGMRMRREGGPWVVAREPIVAKALEGKACAAGGEFLSETIAARVLAPKMRIEVVEDGGKAGNGRNLGIGRRVLDGEFDAGVASAEDFARMEGKGLHAVLDLGAAWGKGEKMGGGCALPLTVMAARRDLGEELMRRAARVMRRSVEYALKNREEALGYAVEALRGAGGSGLGAGGGVKIDIARRLVEGGIGDGAGELGLDSGGEGRRALEDFFERGAEMGLIGDGERGKVEIGDLF